MNYHRFVLASFRGWTVSLPMRETIQALGDSRLASGRAEVCTKVSRLAMELEELYWQSLRLTSWSLTIRLLYLAIVRDETQSLLTFLLGFFCLL